MTNEKRPPRPVQAEIAAYVLRQRQAMKAKYGTDDPCDAMQQILQATLGALGLGSGKES